jgi:hypothetical protein
MALKTGPPGPQPTPALAPLEQVSKVLSVLYIEDASANTRTAIEKKYTEVAKYLQTRKVAARSQLSSQPA